MSPPGRAKGEHRAAQPEGAPVAPSGGPALDKGSLALDSGSLSLRARLLDWDTESLGAPVAQVDHVALHGAEAAAADAAPLHAWLAANRVALASCRLPEARLRESFFLEAAGFRFVEMVYGMRLEVTAETAAEGVHGMAAPDVCWQPAREQDLPALAAVAAAAFETGRWQVDPRIGAAASGRRYAHWVARSLAGGPQQVLLVRDGEGKSARVAGFFIIEDLGDGSSYWHLTAVSPTHQGRGWGRRLWASMIRRHAAAGRHAVRTTVAARNLPVLNLYARQGWRFDHCQMTFHWMPEGGGDA